MHRLLVYATGLLLLSSLFHSCAEDVFGCTDPLSTTYNPEATIEDGTCTYLEERLPGIWEAEALTLDDVDAIGLGIFQSFSIQFNENGTFVYAIVLSNGGVGGATGNWQVIDDTFVNIAYTGNSLTFCGDASHRFATALTSTTQLSLTDNCTDGTSVRLDLIKQ